MDILTFLGIIAGLVASVVTIIVGAFQIGAMRRKDQHNETEVREECSAIVVENQAKEVSETKQPH